MKTLVIASLFASLAAAPHAMADEHAHHAPAKSADAEKANDAEFAKLDRKEFEVASKMLASMHH